MGLTAIQLSDQAEVRELLRVLEGNGLEKEYQEVKALVSYLDSMEARFGQVLNELQEIKGQLSQIQDSGTRDRVVEIVRPSENTVQRTDNKIREAKGMVMEHIKGALQSFKELGIKALQKSIAALKIPALLQGFEQAFHDGKESAERSADKLASIRTEIHAIGAHTKNLGRTFIGKEVQQVEQAPDKGILFKMEKSHRSAANGYSAMEQATADTRRRLENFLAQGKEKKPSVRAELNRLKDESEKAAAERAIPDKNLDSSAQDKHRQDVER